MKASDSIVYEYISGIISPDRILKNEPMSLHTTFKVGGDADLLVKISSENELVKIIPYLKKNNINFFVKGNGSNLLVSDRGYSGVILEISSSMNAVSVEGRVIKAQAGALMSSVARAALDKSLAGFEFASGIPGTIGGGIVMNAGAYDGELRDVVKSVSLMDESGNIIRLSNEEMKFGYRTSILKSESYIVLEVLMELEEGSHDEILQKMEDLSQRRRLKQPIEFPSAGSTFKRPEGFFAGKLIMDAGLRGFSVGGACVSEKHCGFVINKSGATAADVFDVITEVQNRVKSKFDVMLEPEIIFLGDFN